MADNKTPRDEKQKSYYSLNLTEGRRFMIFIGFIVVLAVLLVGVWFVVKSFSKNGQTVNNENKKTENTLAYYYSLTDQEAPKSMKDPTNDIKGDGSEPASFDKKIVQTKVDLSGDEIVKEEPADNIDDSEVLYTSKFKTDEDEKPKHASTKNKTTSPVKNKSVDKHVKKTVKNEQAKSSKSTVKSEVKKSAKKYVVQIGSYSDKKKAEEIAVFYQNNGNYPTFVKNTVSNGKTFYRLRVGPFTDKTRAEQYLTFLKETKYGKNCYISEIYN
jgi:cell division septation protein DedD